MGLLSRLFDAVACLTVAAAAVILWDPPFGTRGNEIYVSLHGSNWKSGASPELALRTIQRAADIALPGDRVIILPGTYFERVHVRRGGTTGRPVRFEAFDPGTVIVSGALPEAVPSDWKWISEGDGIWSTETRCPVYALSADGQVLFRVPWGGLKWLRELVSRPNAWGAFYYENHRLFVFLRGRGHPADGRLVAHVEVPEPREWGEFKSANIWVEADHVVFSGLQFEMGIGSGLLVWNAEDVLIRECAFSGATFGVKCGRGAKPAYKVSVENCLYHNFPQYLWHRDWLSWVECYAGYPYSSLIAAVDDGTRVSNNLVAHAGDGLQISTRDVTIYEGADISGNWLTLCTDDAIELDGHAQRVHFHDNVVFECHEGVSASPVISGPVLVEENLFLNPSDGINGAQLKLISTQVSPASLDMHPIRNLEYRRNAAFGNWLCWSSPGLIENIQVHDNVFCTAHQTVPPWPAGVEARHNVVSTVTTPAVAVSEMIRQMQAAAAHDSALGAVVRRNARRLTIRPGPTWLNWNQCDATRGLLELVERHDP